MIRERKPAKAHLPDEKINYRLIQDWEVPEWIHQSVVEEKKEDPLLFTGKRMRKEVNYKELSDSQAFKMFEAGLDPNLESDVKRARKQQVLTPHQEATPSAEQENSEAVPSQAATLSANNAAETPGLTKVGQVTE